MAAMITIDNGKYAVCNGSVIYTVQHKLRIWALYWSFWCLWCHSIRSTVCLASFHFIICRVISIRMTLLCSWSALRYMRPQVHGFSRYCRFGKVHAHAHKRNTHENKSLGINDLLRLLGIHEKVRTHSFRHRHHYERWGCCVAAICMSLHSLKNCDSTLSQHT